MEDRRYSFFANANNGVVKFKKILASEREHEPGEGQKERELSREADAVLNP